MIIIIYLILNLGCDKKKNEMIFSELNNQNLVLENKIKLEELINVKDAKIFIYNKFVFILDYVHYKIYAYTISGEKLNEYGSKGKAPGEFLFINPELVVNNKYDFYISDQYSQTLNKFHFDEKTNKFCFDKVFHYDNNYAQISVNDNLLIAFNAFPTTNKDKMFTLMKPDFTILSYQCQAPYDFYKIQPKEIVKYSLLYSSSNILLLDKYLYRVLVMDGSFEKYKINKNTIELVDKKTVNLEHKVFWEDLIKQNSTFYETIYGMQSVSNLIIFPIFTKKFDAKNKKQDNKFSKVFYYNEKMEILKFYKIAENHILSSIDSPPLFLDENKICFFKSGYIYFYKIAIDKK